MPNRLDGDEYLAIHPIESNIAQMENGYAEACVSSQSCI